MSITKTMAGAYQKSVKCLLFSSLLFCACKGNAQHEESATLKTAFEDKFAIGTAMNAWQISGRDTAAVRIIQNQFDAIVAENIMKSGRLQPEEGKFTFELADQFVEFGEQNDMLINGHTLIWHSQAPRWFFTDEEGQDVSREVLIERMKTHIHTVVGRYKGRVDTWDVVNEAILDDGSYRESKFYQIIGEDFIKLAFQFAQEADPEAELYYNDYSMAEPGKREGVVRMVKKLQAEGVKIDGIGMQGHIGLHHPDIAEFEKSLEAFADLGVEVMVTELDLTVLPSPWDDQGAEVSKNFDYEDKMNPFPNGLPDEVNEEFNARYLEFFALFLKHQDKISRVTLWGVADQHSWRNGWPIRGRTDYPLLFDRENKAKPIVEKLIKLTKQ